MGEIARADRSVALDLVGTIYGHSLDALVSEISLLLRIIRLFFSLFGSGGTIHYFLSFVLSFV